MAISDESLDQFIDLYANEFGEHLTRAEARPIATNLVNLYRTVMQPPQNPGAEAPPIDPAASRYWQAVLPCGGCRACSMRPRETLCAQAHPSRKKI